MAMRMAARRLVTPRAQLIARRANGGGRVLSEEEKAAENVYIKNMEREKLEKLARKGYSEEEARAILEAKEPEGKTGVKFKPKGREHNYAMYAGILGGITLAYWLFTSSKRDKRRDERRDEKH